MVGLDKDTTFKDIDAELKKPLGTAAPPKGLPTPEVEAVTHTPPMTEPALPAAEPAVSAKPRPKGTKPGKPRARRKTAAS